MLSNTEKMYNMSGMKEKLKTILGECYQIAMILWSFIIGIYFLSFIYHILYFRFYALLHIAREHNFQVGNLFSVLQQKTFTYVNVTVILLWRLTLDIATMYRIANKFKLKWYDFLDGKKWIGSWISNDSFFMRVLQHFFYGIPEAPTSKGDKN